MSRSGCLASAEPMIATLLQLRATLILTPLIGLALAAAAIASYPLSRERVEEIQSLLSGRRKSRETPA